MHCSENEQTHKDYYGTEYTLSGCPQYEFHIANSKIHTTADFGGNRSGKSTCGIVEDAFHATGLYPDWYPEAKQWHKATRGRIFAKDFRVVQEVITPLINEWFPKSKIINKDRNNQGVYTKYYVKHTSNQISTFDIMTYEMDSDQCEGWHGHWVHWDEPPPRAHRAATVRGLTDYGGYEYFSLTPLKEPWIYDEVYQNPEVISVTCDIRHNLRRLNPLTGMYIGLTEENIRITESKWTQEEIAARGRGKFRFLAGRIWKQWEREIHTYDRAMWKAGEHHVLVDGQPPRHWKRVMLIDPHDRKPHALLWAAREPDYRRIFIYREAYLREAEFGDVVRHIRNEEIEAREKVDYRIMDPNFGPKIQGNTKITVRQTFENESYNNHYPMRFDFGIDKKPLGRKAVSELLHYDKTQPISLINRPNLMIAKDCTECIFQIERYVWDDYKYGERDPKEKPKDMNTDYPDLLHYLALFRWESINAEISEGVGSFYGVGY